MLVSGFQMKLPSASKPTWLSSCLKLPCWLSSSPHCTLQLLHAVLFRDTIVIAVLPVR
jgi:hypothetical protein